MKRRVLLVAAVVVTLLAGVAGWRELRARAAVQRGDTAFYGGPEPPWKATDRFAPAPGSHRIPVALAGPEAPRYGAGSVLTLPFTADANYPVRVRLFQLENDRGRPPLLALSLNGGAPARIQTTPGGGLPPDAIEIGTTAMYDAQPPGITRCGVNELRIEAIAGAAIGIARIEIGIEPRQTAAMTPWLAATAAVLWLVAALAAARHSWSRAPASRRRWLHAAAGRAALVLLGCVLGFAAAEAAVRWLAPRSVKVKNLLYSSSDPLAAKESESFLSWIRGHRCAPQPCAPWDDGFRPNRNGFHTHEYTVRKAPGVRRVLGIGDSFMFYGGPVPYADQLFVRLGHEMKMAAPRERREFIDLGVSCIGIPTETAILRHEGLRLDPDVIVWTIYPGNDVTDEHDGSPLLPAERVAPSARGDAPRRTRPPASQLLRLASHVVQLARFEPAALVAPCNSPTAAPADSARCGELDAAAAPPYDPAAPTISDESYQRYGRDHLNTMYRADDRERVASDVALLLRRMAAARPLLANRRVLLVVLPDELAISPAARAPVIAADPALATTRWDFDYPHRAVVNALHEQGWSLLDLAPAFAAATARGESLYQPHDSHFNLAGNHLAAELVAAALRERGWL